MFYFPVNFREVHTEAEELYGNLIFKGTHTKKKNKGKKEKKKKKHQVLKVSSQGNDQIKLGSTSNNNKK